jgi:hypothetical protein
VFGAHGVRFLRYKLRNALQKEAGEDQSKAGALCRDGWRQIDECPYFDMLAHHSFESHPADTEQEIA